MSLLNEDLIKAKMLFESGEYTCVLCKGDAILTSKDRGVKPLIEFFESGDYRGFSAVDKIIGKAAAHLYILMGVISVHASVMSREANELLSKHNIKTSFDTLTESVINRKGDDICPMEKAVAGAEDSEAALKNIKNTIELMGKKQ